MKKLILLPLLLILPSCSGLGDRSQIHPVSAFVGDRKAVGGEVTLGRHAIGIAATYKFNHSWEAAPSATEGEPPFKYPLDDK